MIKQTDDPEKLAAIEPLLEKAESDGVPGGEFLKALGHRPDLAEAWMEYWHETLMTGEADHRIKELIRLRMAQLHDCLYCTGVGSNLAEEQGLTDEKVRELEDYETSPRFSEAERAAIRFAEAFYHDRHDASELEEHFPRSEVIELIVFTAFQDGSEKIVPYLDLEATCEVPEDEEIATPVE